MGWLEWPKIRVKTVRGPAVSTVTTVRIPFRRTLVEHSRGCCGGYTAAVRNTTKHTYHRRLLVRGTSAGNILTAGTHFVVGGREIDVLTTLGRRHRIGVVISSRRTVVSAVGAVPVAVSHVARDRARVTAGRRRRRPFNEVGFLLFLVTSVGFSVGPTFPATGRTVAYKSVHGSHGRRSIVARLLFFLLFCFRYDS